MSALDETTGKYYCVFTGRDWEDRVFILATRSSGNFQKSAAFSDGLSFIAYDPRTSALYAVSEFQGFPVPGCEGTQVTESSWEYPAGCVGYVDPNVPIDPFAPPPPPIPDHEDPKRVLLKVTEQSSNGVITFIFKRIFDSRTDKSYRQTSISTPLKPDIENLMYSPGSGEHSQLFSNIFYFEDKIISSGYMSRDMRPRIQSVEISGNNGYGRLVADSDGATEVMKSMASGVEFTSGVMDLAATMSNRQINSQFAPPVPWIDQLGDPQVSQNVFLPFPSDVLKLRLVDPGAKSGYTYQVFLHAVNAKWRGPASSQLSYGMDNIREGEFISFEGDYSAITSALNSLYIAGGTGDGKTKLSISVKLKVRQDSLNDVFHGIERPVVNQTFATYDDVYDELGNTQISSQFQIKSLQYTVAQEHPDEKTQWPRPRSCSLYPNAPLCARNQRLGNDLTANVPYDIWSSAATMPQGEVREVEYGIKAINDAPVVHLPPPQLIPPDSILMITGINITDTDFYEPLYNVPVNPESGLSPLNNKMNVRLTASEGFMSLDFRFEDYASLVFLEGTTRLNEKMIVVEGEMDIINLALRSIKYDGSGLPAATEALLTIKADDKGNTGFDGSAEWSSKSLSIELTCDLAAAPKVWYAKFDNSGARVNLHFDRPTDRAGMAGSQSCVGLLSEETVGLLGTNSNPPICSWKSDSVLVVEAGNGATLLYDNQAMTLDPEPSKPVKSCITSMFVATGPPTTVEYPEIPPVPISQLVGPAVVGFCEDGEVDSRLTTGGAGRALLSEWTLYRPELIPNQTRAEELNAYLRTQTGSVLIVKNEFLDRGNLYEIQITSTNFFGVRGVPSVFQFSVSTMPLPTVYVEGAPVRVYYKPSKGNYISAMGRLSACMDFGQKLEYKWTIEGNTHPFFWWHEVTRFTRNLWIVPGSLTVGDTYIFKVTGTMAADRRLTAFSAVEVTVLPSDLVCQIVGGDKVIGTRVPAIIDGSISYDPDVFRCQDRPLDDDGEVIDGPCDIIKATDPVMRYEWTCRMADNILLPCFSGRDYTTNMDTLLNSTAVNSIPPGHLVANISYMFILKISKTGKTNQTRSLIVRVMEGAPPEVQIAALSSSKVNRNKKLALEGSAISFYPVMYQWSVIVGDIDFATPGVLTTPINEPNLVISASALTTGALYKFALNVIPMKPDGSFGTMGQGLIEVQVNSPPSGGSLTIEPPEGLASSTSFTLTADDWTDDPEDLPLVYTFRYLTLSGVDIAVSEPQLKNVITTMLPSEGQIRHLKTLVVQVKDAFDGIATFSRTAWINKPRMTVDEKLKFVQDLNDGAMQAAFDRGDVDGIMQLVDALVDVLNDKDGGDAGFWPEIDPDEEPEAYAAQEVKKASQLAELERQTGLILDIGTTMRGKLLENLEKLGQFVEMTPTTIDKQKKAISKISAAAEESGKNAQEKGNDQVKDLVSKTGDKGMEDSTAAAAGQVLSNIIQAGKMLQGANNSANSSNSSGGNSSGGDDSALNAFKASQSGKTDAVLENLVQTILGALKPGEAPVEMASENVQLGTEKAYPAALDGKSYGVPPLPGRKGTDFKLPAAVLENAGANNATEPVVITGTLSEEGGPPVLGSTDIANCSSNCQELTDFMNQFNRGRRLLSQPHRQYNSGRRLLTKSAAAVAAAAGSVDSKSQGADGAQKQGDIEPGTGPIGMMSNLSGLSLSGAGTKIKVEDLPEPIVIKIPTSKEQMANPASQTPACQYWDDTNKRWSSKGCIVSKQDDVWTTCLCSHLTDFGATLVDAEEDLSFIDPLADATAMLALDMSQVGGLIMVCCCFIGYGLGCYYGGKQDTFERDTAEVLQGKIVLRPDGTYEWVEQTLAEVFISRFRADMIQKKDKELMEQEENRQKRIDDFMQEHKEGFDVEKPESAAGEESAETEGKLAKYRHDNPYHDTLIRICWICLEETQPELMMRACKCRDMLEWVHAKCLHMYMEAEGPSALNPLGTEWSFMCPNCAQPYIKPDTFEVPLPELSDTDEDDPVMAMEDELVDFTEMDIIMLQRTMYRTAFSDKKLCFVCLEEEDITNLVNPCGCSGHLKYAHEECFLRWHKESQLIKCPYCDEAFGFRPKKVTSVFGSTEAKVGEVFEGTKLSRIEIFKKVAWEKIKEEHPLMMCLFCPPADAYTRPQRLTVLLAGIYASLLSTAFVMSMAPPESIVEQVIAGVVTVLIVIPVNVVFTGIFSIGQGPKESTESPTVRESEIRETPWARQDRMLNERRWEKANLQEKVWLSVVGKAPSEPPDPAKVYAKVDLDKYGKNSVVDVCKCIAWVMAIFYLLGTGGMIIIYSFMFTPNQNMTWMGMAWLATSQDWVIAKPIGSIQAGLIGAIKGDLEETLLWARDKGEFVWDNLKGFLGLRAVK